MTGSCQNTGVVSGFQQGIYDPCLGGSIEFIWDGVDNCGNPIVHTQTITVAPAMAATFNDLPADQTITCSAIPPLQDLTYSSNYCPKTSGSIAGTEVNNLNGCNGGTIVRTWEGNDNCGNFLSHTQVLTVGPTSPASFVNLPIDMTIACDDALPPLEPLQFSNNDPDCEIIGSIEGNMILEENGCEGQITYLWEGADNCGNLLAHIQTITQTCPPPIANAGPDMLLSCSTESLTLDGTNSSPNEIYQWNTNDGFIASGGNTLTPEINSAGTYTLTVNSATGCSSQDSVVVEQDINAPSFTIEGSNQLSCSNTEQALTIVPTTGSVNNYTYQWEGAGIIQGGNTNAPIVNQVGTYIVVVTDNANGCSTTQSFEISQAEELNFTLNNTSQILCFGESTGSIESEIISGTAPYQYLWSNGNTTTSLENIAAGSYTLSITDSNACIATQSIEINQASELTSTITYINQTLTCTGDPLDYEITVQGGTPPYTYAWSDGSSQAQLENITETNYSLTITDNNNCTLIEELEFSIEDDIPNIEINSNTTVLDCNQLQINLTASSNGTAVSYIWYNEDGEAISDQATILVEEPGLYNVVATNTNNACTAQATTTITQDIIDPVFEIVGLESIDCENPSVELEAVSNDSNVDYDWINQNGATVGTNNTFTTSDCGLYQVTLTNINNGCTATQSFEIECQLDLPQLLLSEDQNFDIDCNSEPIFPLNIEATIDENNTNLSYFWSVNGDTIPNAETLDLEITQAGEYVFHLQDTASGCSTSDTVSITVNNLDAPIASISSSGILNCINTTVALDGTNSSGISDLTYQWTGAMGVFISTQANIEVTEPGYYSLIVRDNIGCTDQQLIQVEADELQFNFSHETPLCHDDIIEVQSQVSGTNPPFNLNWSNGTIESSINYANEDTYTVMITDSLGCTWEESIENIEFPDELREKTLIVTNETGTNSNGLIVVQGGGGTPPYTHTWSTGAVSSTIYNLSAGFYSVTISDANDCTYVIEDIEVQSLVIPDFDSTDQFNTSENSFYQNNKEELLFNDVKHQVNIYPNPNNGNFSINTTQDLADTHLYIFNAQGQQIYDNQNLKGKHSVIELPNNLTSGLYLIYLESPDSKTMQKIIIDKD